MRSRTPCVLLALAILLAVPTARTSAQTTRCGVERWPVKILADPDARFVNRTPLAASVTSLRAIPRPAGQLPERGRSTTAERQVYRVQAIVQKIITESDGDWHLVLADPDNPSATLVAEIPDSACAYGTADATTFAAVRRDMHAAGRQALIEVDGVAFFDFLHGQRGMAPSGLELHPLLHVRVLSASTAGRAPTSTQSSRGASRPSTTSIPARGTAQGGNAGQVWLNTSSRVYHCPGSRYYGATAHGEYVTEAEAVRRGARPVGGRSCGGSEQRPLACATLPVGCGLVAVPCPVSGTSSDCRRCHSCSHEDRREWPRRARTDAPAALMSPPSLSQPAVVLGGAVVGGAGTTDQGAR
jgi:hypothetical protein